MPNVFTPISNSSSDAARTNQINQNFAKLDAEAVTKTYRGPHGNAQVVGRLPNNLGYGTIIYDLSGVPSIYIATDKDGNPIMKVAKTGQDATTGSGDNLTFDSSQDTFKIVKTGTALLNIAQTSGDQTFTVSVPHGQTKIPAVIAFASGTNLNGIAGSYVQLPYSPPVYSSANAAYLTAGFLSFYIDATNVTFYAQICQPFGNGITSIKYYILAESAV
jgi:hypothetical protein